MGYLHDFLRLICAEACAEACAETPRVGSVAGVIHNSFV